MKNLGIYIHIPFCVQKCLYCDFTSFAGMEENIGLYLDALEKEMAQCREKFADYAADSVFIGGGTPSCLPEGCVSRIFNSLKANFNIHPEAEITLEANPGTITEGKLKEYRENGINRLSIGMQSDDDALLKTLGRIHNVKTFLEGFEMARAAGFNNLNVDVMFGLPGQTQEGFTQTLQNVIKLNPEHISAYALIIEEHTPFFKQYGDTEIIPEEAERGMYHTAVRMLKNAGYAHYETSNFAKKNHACKHNLKYWTQSEYLGLGLAAHSYYAEGKAWVRAENTSDLGAYTAALKEDNTPVLNRTVLNGKDLLTEYIMLRLRLKDGIAYNDFFERFGFAFPDTFLEEIKMLKKARFIHEDESGIRPLIKGFDMQNTLICEFIKKI